MELERIIWDEEKNIYTNKNKEKVNAEAISKPFVLLYDNGWWDYEDKKEEQIQRDVVKYIEKNSLTNADAYLCSKEEVGWTSTIYAVQLFSKKKNGTIRTSRRDCI